MALPQTEIIGKVVLPNTAGVALSSLTFRTSHPVRVSDGTANQVIAFEVTVALAADGSIPEVAGVSTLKLVPTDVGAPAGWYYHVEGKGSIAGVPKSFPAKVYVPSAPARISFGDLTWIQGSPLQAYGPDQQTLAARDAAVAAAAQAAVDGAAAGTTAGAAAGTIAGAAAAEPYATAAAGSASAAATAETNAELAEAHAETAQGLAESARDAALATGKVYPDTTTGLAAEAEGAYFNIPSGTTGEALILYRKESGLAVEKKRTMSNRGQLAAWMSEEAYRPSGTLTYNSQGRVASPINITWPDAATGVLTITYNGDGTVASMSATHIDGSGTLTVAQPTITYVNGVPTVIPAITVT